MADEFVTRCRPCCKTSAGPLCVSFSKNLLVWVKGPTYFLCPHSLSVPRWLTDCYLALRTRRTVPSQLDPAKWPNRMDDWEKNKTSGSRDKKIEKSHTRVCEPETWAVSQITYFRLDYFTAVLLLRGALILTWVVLSQITLPISMFLTATSSTATFLTVNCKQTERQKDSISYVNQMHITSFMPD